MKRRDFLKDSALGAAAAALGLGLSACGREPRFPWDIARSFPFRADGTFKLLQFTDTHYIIGDPRSERALRAVEEMLDTEKPDLVIHTGDIVFGRPDGPSAEEILRPIALRGIPFAVALGNHDAQFGTSREAMLELIRAIPGCVNTPVKEGLSGCSNDVITLNGPDGVERVFYLFDSGDAVILKGEEDQHCYDYIRYDQIGWYRAFSQRFTRENGGVPVPSLAFFHIPLRELEEALEGPETDRIGNNCEPPCPSRLNSGLFAQARELGDIEAFVYGHDHDCDYVQRQSTLFHIYGRYSGCDTVYNHLGLNGADGHPVSGARLFEFRCGKPGFRTWVRLCGGEVQQDLYLCDGKAEPYRFQ